MSIAAAKSAYSYFCSEQHAQRRSDSGSMGDRMREIAEAWRELDASARAKYDKLAEKDRARFDRESADRDRAALEEQARKRADQHNGGLGARRCKQQREESDYDSDDDDDESEDSEDSDSEDSDGSAKKRKTKKLKQRRKRTKTASKGKKKKPVSTARQKELTAARKEKAARDSNIAASHEDLRRRVAASAASRLKYLLSQSDIFAHFGVGKTISAQQQQKRTKSPASSAAPGVSSPGGSRRRDSGMIAALDDDDDADIPEGEADAADAAEDAEDAEAQFLQAQPASVTGGTMRPYQLEGLNWMIRLWHHGMNGILADEMGLGKTLQCISILAWLREAKGVRGPHLVLAPKSTLGNWIGEFQRWCPETRAVRFHGSKQERKDFVESVLRPGAADRSWDVVVATYEVANAERTALEKIAWCFVIIDEAHRVKNEASLFARTARALHAERRLLVTGTPLQNNLHELWALLNYLLPDVFASSEQFDEWFNLDVDDADAKKQMIQQLHKLLRPFVLRRLKADVEKTLPPKTETLLFTGLTKMQKDLYRSLLKREARVLLSETSQAPSSEEMNTTAGPSRASISNICMQLRKCCNHPYLFPGVEDRTLPALGSHVVDNCGKLKLLDKLLDKLKSRGHRVLVFSQMTQLLDVLEDFMVMRGYKYCRIDGNTSYDDRDELIEAYNAANSEKFVFLLSTRAGGLGINLQTADTCILYDSDWNPQADLQAMDRCHRIGQRKPVSVYRLVTANTIEEKVVERAHKKLKLDAMVVQQGRLANAKQGGTGGNPSKDEMLEAVKFGASAIFRGDGDDPITDDDIDAILDRGKEKTKALLDKLEAFNSAGEDLLDFKLDGGGSQVQRFEGVDYSKEENRVQQQQKQSEDDELRASLFAALDKEENKRERQRATVSYSETHPRAEGPREVKPKNPVPPHRRLPHRMEDWQFFDATRLREIGDVEEKAFAEIVAAGDDLKLDAAKVNGVLSPEMEAEKNRLLAAGFGTWTKQRFRDWVKAVGRRGRENHAAVAHAVGLDEDECRRYAQTFWTEGQTRLQPADWDRAVKAIERGEKEIAKNFTLRSSVRRLVLTCDVPTHAVGLAEKKTGPAPMDVDDDHQDALIQDDDQGVKRESLEEKKPHDADGGLIATEDTEKNDNGDVPATTTTTTTGPATILAASSTPVRAAACTEKKQPDDVDLIVESYDKALDRLPVDREPKGDEWERPFSRAEDRWLVCAADAFGAPDPDGGDLVVKARQSDRFSLDTFMLSRQPAQLARRAYDLAKKAEGLAGEADKEATKKARGDGRKVNGAQDRRTLADVDAELEATRAALSFKLSEEYAAVDEEFVHKKNKDVVLKRWRDLDKQGTPPIRAAKDGKTKKHFDRPFLAYVEAKAFLVVQDLLHKEQQAREQGDQPQHHVVVHKKRPRDDDDDDERAHDDERADERTDDDDEAREDQNGSAAAAATTNGGASAGAAPPPPPGSEKDAMMDVESDRQSDRQSTTFAEEDEQKILAKRDKVLAILESMWLAEPDKVKRDWENKCAGPETSAFAVASAKKPGLEKDKPKEKPGPKKNGPAKNQAKNVKIPKKKKKTSAPATPDFSLPADENELKPPSQRSSSSSPRSSVDQKPKPPDVPVGNRPPASPRIPKKKKAKASSSDEHHPSTVPEDAAV